MVRSVLSVRCGRCVMMAIALSLGIFACAPASQQSTPSSREETAAPVSAADAGSAHDHSHTDHGGMHHGSKTEMEHHAAMNLGPADAAYDLRFIDAMIPHHEGAIVMAKDALKQSKRKEIQTLAASIIQAQEREINDLMRPWRKAWYPQASDTPMAYDAQQGKMLPMTDAQRASMMMSMDLGSADDQFDLRFLNAMIPHHEGAIVMAKDALQKSQRPELKKLATDILSSQQAEIDEMKQWRREWYQQ